MTIDELMDGLRKLRKTYGNIEVDASCNGAFCALHGGIPVRIDEFGDVVAVLQVFQGDNGSTVRGLNELAQDDSWAQFKENGVSDDEARKRWEDAGKPSRMRHMDLVGTEDVEKAYLVHYYYTGDYFGKFSHSTAILHSSLTGKDLYYDLLDKLPGSPIYTIENIVFLG